MGLGSLITVSLAEARELALDCRKLRLAGIDPITARADQRQQIKLEAARALTFRECAEAYIAANKAGWSNPKHAAQWSATLSTYAYPVMGDLPVAAIDVALVMKVLDPIWSTKNETASRLRGRIERVLDWASVQGYRDGANPARWRGHLDHLLPRPSKVQRVKHHAALPYADIPAFMLQLRQQKGMAALALEFAILTVTRTGEVIGATWDEIDLDQAVWMIPAERMKAKREHRVPLSAPALAILRALQTVRQNRFVFPGGKRGRGLSNMAFLTLLHRMGCSDLTAHGFRSTFKDWATERTEFPNEVSELALAHAVGDKVEAAYRRGDLLDKRRNLVDIWAQYCNSAATTPVQLARPWDGRSRSTRGSLT